MYHYWSTLAFTLAVLAGANLAGARRSNLWDISRRAKSGIHTTTHPGHNYYPVNGRPHHRNPVFWQGRPRVEPRSDLSWRRASSGQSCDVYDGNPLKCKVQGCFFCCSDDYCYESKSEAPDCIECEESELIMSRNVCSRNAVTSSAGLFYNSDFNFGDPGRSWYHCESIDPRLSVRWNISQHDTQLYSNFAWAWDTETEPVYRAPISFNFWVTKDGVYDVLIGFMDFNPITGNGKKHRQMYWTLNGNYVYLYLDSIRYKLGEVCHIVFTFEVRGHVLFLPGGGSIILRSNKIAELVLKQHQRDNIDYYAAIVSTIYVSRRR